MAVDLHPGGPATAGAGSPATPNLEGLCQAVGSGNGTDHGANLDATAFQALASAADNHDTINTYCQALMEKDQASGTPKGPKDTKQPKEPEQPERPVPSGNGGHGQGGPPADGEHAPRAEPHL